MRLIWVLFGAAISGCASSAIPDENVARCSASQAAPFAAIASAEGPRCTPPSEDNVHVEVSAETYRIIVTSLDGYSSGQHAVYVDINERIGMSGTATMYSTEGGWMLSVSAADFDVTLSGS